MRCEVGQIGNGVALVRDVGVELQCAVDALQDRVVYFVLAGQSGLWGEAVLLLRVAGRAVGRQFGWFGGCAVLGGKGGTFPVVLHVLVPHCKRMLIFRPGRTARRELPARVLTTVLCCWLSDLQLAVSVGFGPKAIAAGVLLLIHYN